jgi:5'-3' exonuclease
MIFDMLAKFKQELKENFPYKVIDVEGAEADDIIGTLVPRAASSEKVLILSSDGDFLQLQRYGANVKQYNPAQKKYVKSADPISDLKLKIIEGDKGDGIPNVLSASDVFVREVRQKPLTKGVKEKLMKEVAEEWQDQNAYGGFTRNRMLIDLTYIPEEIKQSIINNYEEVKPAGRSKLLNYFMKYKLKNLMDVIEEF